MEALSEESTGQAYCNASEDTIPVDSRGCESAQNRRHCFFLPQFCFAQLEVGGVRTIRISSSSESGNWIGAGGVLSMNRC